MVVKDSGNLSPTSLLDFWKGTVQFSGHKQVAKKVAKTKSHTHTKKKKKKKILSLRTDTQKYAIIASELSAYIAQVGSTLSLASL